MRLANAIFCFSKYHLRKLVKKDALRFFSGVQLNFPSDGNVSKSELSSGNYPYDIAIVGGGMVGLALACSLANNPLTKHLNVAIIDGSPTLGTKLCIKKEDPPDPRVSTVTPATISNFKDVGAWQYIEEHRNAFFSKMQVWDYTGLGYTRYDSRDVHKDVLGCVVENKVLCGSLWARIEDSDLKKTLYHAKLTSMSLLQNSSLPLETLPLCEALHAKGRVVKLELSDGSNLFARLVVGADGSKSQVRELAGIKTTGWSYPQNALICSVEHSIENCCAWQRFLPSGPIALLPMGDNYSNIVWTMTPESASKHKVVDESDFINLVNKVFSDEYGPQPSNSMHMGNNILSWLGNHVPGSANESFETPPKVVKLASPRLSFPLSLMHSKHYASNRVVLVGDAAHTVHPLAGQGVNLGFEDAFALTKIIADGVAVGSDIGEFCMLKKYETERKPANMVMMAILDGFQKAYSVDLGPLNVIRGAAFHAAQYISPLKKSIISYASGEQKLPLFH